MRTQITTVFDERLPQPSVSKHLRVLRDVGLVQVRRDGRQMLYRTNADAIRPLHLSINLTEDIHVRAPISATFDALLEELGPANEGHNHTPMPMVLEPWPGGRWFRDLGGQGRLECALDQVRRHPA